MSEGRAEISRTAAVKAEAFAETAAHSGRGAVCSYGHRWVTKLLMKSGSESTSLYQDVLTRQTPRHTRIAMKGS